MFTSNLPQVGYSDPWNLAFHDRFHGMANGKRRVAYFYECANNSTFRYRAYNMVQVLNHYSESDVSAGYFFLEDLSHFDRIADSAHLLVICRSRYCHQIAHLVSKFRARGKRILFDIDDLVFDASYAHLIIDTLDQNRENSEIWDYWFAYIGRMGAALNLCDGAITTNNYLADKIRAFSGLPVSVIPNFINIEQLEISDSLFRSKESSLFSRDDKISLGYFSGSPSHNLDYELVTSALEQVLEDDDRVEILIVGYIEAGPLLSRFGNRIRYSPFQDYVNLQRLIAGVEFNLVPLQSNAFTNCKSELKYFEAAIAGTLSIASPSYTYSNSIADGNNGYIAKAYQWTCVIQKAIANIDSYKEMATAAYADARAKYSWFNQRECILKALDMN